MDKVDQLKDKTYQLDEACDLLDSAKDILKEHALDDLAGEITYLIGAIKHEIEDLEHIIKLAESYYKY